MWWMLRTIRKVASRHPWAPTRAIHTVRRIAALRSVCPNITYRSLFNTLKVVNRAMQLLLYIRKSRRGSRFACEQSPVAYGALDFNGTNGENSHRHMPSASGDIIVTATLVAVFERLTKIIYGFQRTSTMWQTYKFVSWAPTHQHKYSRSEFEI